MKVADLAFAAEDIRAEYLTPNGFMVEVILRSRTGLYSVRIGRAFNGTWNAMAGEHYVSNITQPKVDLLLQQVETDWT
jgi:hypothetical protein